MLTLAMAVGLLSGTAHAAITWSENQTISSTQQTQQIDGGVTVTANITLTIPSGVTLSVDGGIDAGNNTLTVSGGGTLIVRGTNGTNGTEGGYGFTGNMIVKGTTVQVTGGTGGASDMIGGTGGKGIYGKIAVNSGSVTITGGNGGDGDKARAVAGTITASKAQESNSGGNDSANWTDITDTTSVKPYVKIEIIISVTGVSLDKTAITNLPLGDTVTLTATVSPDNATSKAVTWTTSSKDIASVDQSGKVTAMGVGTATITVTATNGTTETTDDKTATCTVTVIKNPTITFDANDGSGSMNVQTISYDVATPLTANAFTRTGYTFSGWNTSADATGTSYADKASIKVSADKTLYAQWTAIIYVISYDLNGGTNNASNPISYTVTSPDITLQAPTKTGYTFAKWTSGDTEITSIPQGSTGNMTLKANWTLINYAISYDLDGGTNNASNPTSYTVTSPDITLQAPTKTGYTFAKWTSGDTEITSIPQGSTGDMTLKANWTANTYTVKFNGNGGTGSMSDLTLTYDVEQALSNNTFTRTGYTFNNWKDNDGNKSYNGGASVKNLTTVNGATITLYAQWKVNQYTLTFNTNGGSAISAITQDYGTAVTAPANPTKEGYTFNGWDKEIPSTMPAENLTFTAQ
ncbi:MAG: InlB B-repeat-containing protein [Synergistales bacterium]|nr:InlB B-repeat-containing protein [Synergistales bacterium]